MARLNLPVVTSLTLAAVSLGTAASGGTSVPSHIVVVIEENHDANQIIGSANAPYINNTLKAGGLYFSNSHGVDHDSQPNYMELFSGGNPGNPGINFPLQYKYPTNIDTGITTNPIDVAAANRENNSDNYNTGQPFSTPNLGAGLLSKGLTFAGYSEDLPSVGFTGKQAIGAQGVRSYVEKHNAWAQWQGSGTNQLPASVNQPLSAFPSDFTKLPTVSFVVPNEQNDMHDTVSATGLRAGSTPGLDKNGKPVTDATTIQHGDNWLKTNIDAYRQWAIQNNSLLIVTWDENDFNFSRANNIATIVDGSPNLVQTGVNDRYVNHFDLLRTIENYYGVAPTGLAAVAPGFTSDGNGRLTAVPLPTAFWAGLLGLMTLGGVGLVRGRRIGRA